MANYVFYPIALRATISGQASSQFSALIRLGAFFSVDVPVGSGGNGQGFLDRVTIIATEETEFGFIYNINPEFHAFPPVLGTARSTLLADNTLAVLLLRIATFDATAMAATDVNVDCRFLAFPEPVVQSAGFYQPRLYFKLN